MKRIFTMALLVAFGFGLNAQLAPGSYLPGNVTGVDVVGGPDVDLQAWLDDGKYVVVDVFATWCGPCWTFHQSGRLDEYNEMYGPNGTDQIRVLGVEAYSGTPEDYLFQESGTSGTYNYSIGDWTSSPTTGEKVTYPIINSDAANSTLAVGYYPSLYMIKPNGQLVELGTISPNPRNDDGFWHAALGLSDDPFMSMESDLVNSSFCGEKEATTGTATFFNASHLDATSAKLEVFVNGTSYSSQEITDPIGSFSNVEVEFEIPAFTEASEVVVGLTEINGVAGDYAGAAASYDKYLNETKTFTVLFTTDFYPSETSWSLRDGSGNVLLNVAYTGNGQGGGADSEKTFEYEVEVDYGTDCLLFEVNDSYGDGLSGVTINVDREHPPGIEVMDENGNYVKDNFIVIENNAITDGAGEWAGGFNQINLNMESSVSNVGTNDIEGLSSFALASNPVLNDLTLNIDLKQSGAYSLEISNLMGQTVERQNVELLSGSNVQTVDVSNLVNGIYNVSLIKGNDEVNTLRFVKY